jgi:hypothetical protein
MSRVRSLSLGKPEIDRAAVGISFVDLLFALAVGQVFEPIARWASDAAADISAEQWMALVVALTLIITSWIGYHVSANRSRFLVKFVNVELVKFTLDVLMVAIYFYIAAVAARDSSDSGVIAQRQSVAVAVAFLLYALWDLASAWQKRSNHYRDVVKAAVKDPTLPAIQEEWKQTEWSRVTVTVVWLLGLASYALEVQTWDNMTTTDARWVFGTLIAALVFYRLAKEFAPAFGGAGSQEGTAA